MSGENDSRTRTLTPAQTDEGAVGEHAFEIEVVAGPSAGRVYRVSERTVAGSDSEVDVVIDDPTVSRRHVEFRPVADGLIAVDLGSKNGTRVGGFAVHQALLSVGSECSIGSTVMRVHRPATMPSAGHSVRFGEYMTCNGGMVHTLKRLRKAAASEVTVLIEGPTGTGKELLARGVHDASARRDAPFVVVDCSAVSPNLLESQLFGHKKGAFTGAAKDVLGAFEAASGGTVFLDELGELPLALQPKLLRALEARRIRRVGDVKERPIDVRFVAATNRDLEVMTAQREFREDLFFRVAVVRIRVPPLCERPEDIPMLAAHFAEHVSSERVRIAPEAYVALGSYHWPGNARELRNVIQQAVALADKPFISPEDLFVESSPPTSFQEAKDQLIASFEVRYVRALLERHEGNVSRAARAAGLSRNAMYALIRRAGLDTTS